MTMPHLEKIRESANAVYNVLDDITSTMHTDIIDTVIELIDENDDIDSACAELSAIYSSFDETHFRRLYSSNDLGEMLCYVSDLSAHQNLSANTTNNLIKTINPLMRNICEELWSEYAQVPVIITPEIVDILRYAIAFSKGYDMDEVGETK